MSQQNSSLFGGILLVAGTTVGGGMLALPVLTGAGGFVPSLAIFASCWLFMMATGLLFLELSLVTKKDANMISMAGQTLGKVGQIAAWMMYLFLFYCLTLAYIVGCGNLVTDMSNNTIPSWAGPLVFVAFFGPIVFTGISFVGKINALLMLGLSLSFVAFVFLGFGHIDPLLLARQDWPRSLAALPIAFTSFAYQGIIPTLVNHMHYDVRKIRLAIIIGSAIPLFIYAIWQSLILGIIPLDGPEGLAEALLQGENAVHPLKSFIQSPYVYTVASFFAFFALVTSFFGVTLGLLDFFADGLKIKKDKRGKAFLCLLIFLPPLLISYWHPDVFLTALEYAGGFGSALLLGVMPILMVWSLRYRTSVHSPYKLWGGKVILLILMTFVLFELGFEIARIFEKLNY